MKRLCFRIGVVAFVLTFISYPLLIGNVLQNPGFEDDLNSWQITGGSAIIITDPMGVRNGNNSLLTENTGIVTFKQSGIPVEPYTWYKLTVHSKFKHDQNSWTEVYNCWSKFYVDLEEIYWAWHYWGQSIWLQDDWVIFNTDDKTMIEITIERFLNSLPPGGSGIVYDDIILTPYDTIRPQILSAEASDGDNPGPGIDDDDYVTIAFSEPTNKIPIQMFFEVLYELIVHQIDIVFKLVNDHTWLDGSGNIKEAVWNERGDTVTVYLSTESGLPTIKVGDTIRPGRCQILDECGNPILRDIVVLTGSFGEEGVEERSMSKPFTLLQNCPNPFNSQTSVSYQLPNDQHVFLDVYDICGCLVTTLVNGNQEAGLYKVCWDGKNELGRNSPAGVYFYRLKAGDLVSIKKMVLLRK